MVNVSRNYNPYRDARHVDMLIEFDLSEHEATQNGTIYVNNYETISNFSQLKQSDYRDKKYATCEDGLVLLDGTWSYMPDDTSNEHIGWWGKSISNENAEFNVTPTFTVEFTNIYSCVGFTLESSKTNPIQECRVRCYNDDTLLCDEIIESDDNVMLVDTPVNNFNKVIFEVLKTKQPRRRVKILSFNVGILKRFNKNDIVQATITEEASINSETLPINELSFEIYDPKKYFSNYHSNARYRDSQATNKANITAVNASNISILNQLKDLNTKLYKYATCEDGYTLLDGTYRYLPDNLSGTNKQLAFINNQISDIYGHFTNIPKITYSWSNTVEFSGLRIFFGGDSYPTEILVKIYNGNTLLGTENIYNDEDVCDIYFGAKQCTSVELSFNEMEKGYRYLKISDIQVMKDIDGWVSRITKSHNIKASIIIDGEKINVGSKYMFNRLEQNENGLTTTIVAKDYISKLDRQHCPVGSNTQITLDQAITNLLTNSGITINYGNNISANTSVRNTPPKDTSKRAGIHYFTQAAKATCFLDRNKVLQVRQLNKGKSVDYLNMDNIYKADILRLSDYINMIRLSVPNPYIDPEPEPSRYYGGSGLYYREIENSCVPSQNGQAVANWLLSQAERRIYFEMETRGNPALELGDTVKIKTKEGVIYFAVIFSQTFEYNGGLKSTIKAVI